MPPDVVVDGIAGRARVAELASGAEPEQALAPEQDQLGAGALAAEVRDS